MFIHHTKVFNCTTLIFCSVFINKCLQNGISFRLSDHVSECNNSNSNSNNKQ